MGSKLPDLTGQTFGLWSVIAPAESDKSGRKRYLCRCTCGKERVVFADNLRRGVSTSCGHTGIAKRADKLRGKNFGPPAATRTCVICGETFQAPPSSAKVTCSKECSSAHHSKVRTGRRHPWGEDKKIHAKEAAAKTGNLKNGTAAALKNPLNQRGPQNKCAKVWHLRDPDGNAVTVVNLMDWARLHAKDYFDMEPTDKSAQTISAGFQQIKRSMEGRTRDRYGRPYTVSTYKGWTLVAWEEKRRKIIMTDKQFYTLWTEALASADRDAYVSDWAMSSIWGDAEDAPIPAGRAEDIGAVWDLAHLSIRDIRASTGLSQVAFAQRFCIPRRTLEDWEASRRSCPDYVRLLLARAVEK